MKGGNLGARVLLVTAGVALSLAYSSWIASRTVLDPHNTKALATELLATPAVHDRLADQATEALDGQLSASLRNPAAVARLKHGVDEALRDPRFTAAFAGAIAQLHAALMGTGGQKIEIDPHAFTASLQHALATSDPALAKSIAKTAPVKLDIGNKDMPSLKGVRDTASLVMLLGVLAGLALIAAALALDRSRRMVGRLGRRLIYLAIVPVAMFVLVPMWVESQGDAGQIIGVVLRSYRGRVLPSVFVVVAIGCAIALGALLWPRRPSDAVPTDDAPQPSDRVWDDLPSPLLPAAPETPEGIAAS